MGIRTEQKYTIIDITSDSQVNSNFPYRWSPASLTFNNYFYLFLYLYLTRITINKNAPHLQSPKNQTRRAALGRPAMKILCVCGGGSIKDYRGQAVEDVRIYILQFRTRLIDFFYLFFKIIQPTHNTIDSYTYVAQRSIHVHKFDK